MNWERLILVLLPLLAVGCSSAEDQPSTLTLATTTNTRDSGLLDVLVPMFEKQTGIEVKVVAVGNRQALELGRRGDADVLLTHALESEREFMAEGFGEERRTVMSNDFVLVGPETDPARIKGEESIVAALRQIARSEAPFVSQGDESGTHMKERQIWQQAGIKPQGDWYISAGAGMAEVLRIASEKRAYTLTDRGTFLTQRKGLDLTILSEGDPLLQNQYSVIVVGSERHPHVHAEAAQRFTEFLLSPKVQKLIGEYGVERYGQPLFFPVQSPE